MASLVLRFGTYMPGSKHEASGNGQKPAYIGNLAPRGLLQASFLCMVLMSVDTGTFFDSLYRQTSYAAP